MKADEDDHENFDDEDEDAEHDDDNVKERFCP